MIFCCFVVVLYTLFLPLACNCVFYCRIHDYGRCPLIDLLFFVKSFEVPHTNNFMFFGLVAIETPENSNRFVSCHQIVDEECQSSLIFLGWSMNQNPSWSYLWCTDSINNRACRIFVERSWSIQVSHFLEHLQFFTGVRGVFGILSQMYYWALLGKSFKQLSKLPKRSKEYSFMALTITAFSCFCMCNTIFLMFINLRFYLQVLKKVCLILMFVNI